ncbi:AraC family transcriptional regulator [Streptomyces sp. NPDC046915]|uniref:AraC family transcriptional regulator n=1 Tax=Streptomyces sp. NPDC046915 TaxID=3155257 RepID=UPI0033F9881F
MHGEAWTRYWRDPERPLEAMHAHFYEHVYAPHRHDTYSFGFTEEGAQRFHCRGASHVSGAGMVMAFNPDEPHDGQSSSDLGYQYRIVHLGPDLVGAVLADAADGARHPVPLPLFAEPAFHDPVLSRALTRLHAALTGGAEELVRDERLTAAVTAMAARGATRPARIRLLSAAGEQTRAVRRARDVLRERFAEQLSARDLADAAGVSRFALYRAFREEYGMAPSDYQRHLRLSRARQLLAAGRPAALAAAETGFADQSHLHRWFVRSYGVTPGVFQRAAGP